MRQIGTLPKNLDPKAFADHLLTFGMKTRIDERPEGWDLWIYNEDHFNRAREELQGYLSNPEDPRYRDATQTAQAIRRREQQLDKQFRKNYREVSDLWAAPGLRRRPLTAALIATCVVVFVLQQSPRANEVEDRLFFTTYRADPNGNIQSNEDILHGEVWRLVTPSFMHSRRFFLHILFNMWWLNALGTLIEIRRGTLRLLGLVLITAVISNLSQYLWMERTDPGKPHWFLGMSGVVYGLFGYIWMKGLYEPEQGMFMHPNNVNIMILWLVLCMTGVLGPIGNAAHFMGMVAGMTLGVLRY